MRFCGYKIGVGGILGLVACLCLTIAFANDGPDKPGDQPKTTVKESGPIQGMLVEDQRATMALVSKNESIPKNFQDTIPYVCVYLKDGSGKQDSVPYALNLSGGELMLQIPRVKGGPQIIPMRRVVALIEAAEQLNNHAK